MTDPLMLSWLAALEARHLANLTFTEVTHALRALSSTYVERRERLMRKTAFDSAGKRAAYALYYSPLHYLTVCEILRAIENGRSGVRHVLDLGCGAGAAGAAWATYTVQSRGDTRNDRSLVKVTGVDCHPWALTEAAFTYRLLGIEGETRRGDAGRAHPGRTIDAVIAGWVLNELNERSRAAARSHLLAAANRGAQVLIIEPISSRVSPWWSDWAQAFTKVGARADEWTFHVDFPDPLKRLARAARLKDGVVKARTLSYRPDEPSKVNY